MKLFSLVRTAVLCAAILLSGVALAQSGRESIEERLDKFTQKLEALDRSNWELMVKLYTVAAVLAGIAGLAGLSRLFSGAENVKRERTITRMLELMARGEEAAQQRVDQLHNVMLKEGRTTLQLVNETLLLAKTASEGAVTAAHNRVTKRAAELEQEAAAFLRPYANRDNRDFVNNINERDKLRKLIDKVRDLEQVNNTLEHPIKFGPNTHFLQALDYYIEKHFDETIETLQVLVERTDVTVPVDLKIRCLYWIAYEQNNIGKFFESEVSFESAISLAEQSRAPIERILELKRLHIESMLFNTRNYKAADLIDNINEVMGQCGTLDDTAVLDNLALTKGNILFAAAMDVYDKGNAAQAVAYMHEAKQLLEPLASLDHPELGKEFAQRDWGLISILLREDEERAAALLNREVRNWARKQVANRMGAHHKASFTALQLIILKACSPEDRRIPPLDIQITRYVGDVHERVMIYSPLRKRNVNREVFLEDVRSVVNSGLPYIVQKPS